jgi:hypothetical protein
MKTIISEETEQGWLDSFNSSYNLELKIGDVIDVEVDDLADEFNHMIANGPAILTTKEKD